MTDQITEIQSIPSFKVAEEDRLVNAIKGLRENLRTDLKERGFLTLDELLDKVYDWENVYGEKLSEEEFEVLSILSLVLGTSKMVLDKSVGVKKGEVEKSVFIESVRAQQEILRTLLSNLDENGRPNRAIAKSFSLVTEIFDEYFDPNSPKLETTGIERESGFWQGIRGMTTTAMLFRQIGWEVKFPPPALDVNYEMDLIVKSPTGEIYGADITAKRPYIKDEFGNLSEAFHVQKGRKPRNLPKDMVEDLQGYIRINIPPIGTRASLDFYEDRVTGFPSQSAINKFSGLL